LGLTAPSFGLRQQIDKAFDRYAIDPNVFCLTNSLNLMKGIACFDRQCALLPRFAVTKEVAGRNPLHNCGQGVDGGPNGALRLRAQ
jgi:hypothetical protein